MVCGGVQGFYIASIRSNIFSNRKGMHTPAHPRKQPFDRQSKPPTKARLSGLRTATNNTHFD